MSYPHGVATVPSRDASLQDVNPSMLSRPVVLALVVGRRGRATLQQGLQGVVQVCCVDYVAELRSTVERLGESVLAIIVEPRDAAGVTVVPTVKWSVEVNGDLPVIGYCSAGPHLSREILDLANAGIQELIVEGVSDTGRALRETLRSAAQASAAERALAAVVNLLPAAIHPVAEVTIRYPRDATSVDSVANALAIHRKTLVNLCRRHRVMAPGLLINWCRLLLAAAMLSRTSRSADAVALELDFPSGSAFRNMLMRYAARRPRDLRPHDALASLTHAFGTALRATSGG